MALWKIWEVLVCPERMHRFGRRKSRVNQLAWVHLEYLGKQACAYPCIQHIRGFLVMMICMTLHTHQFDSDFPHKPGSAASPLIFFLHLFEKTEWWGTGVVICLQWGANDLHMVQLMPLPPDHLLCQQNPEWFAFLVPAYPGCPGKRR